MRRMWMLLLVLVLTVVIMAVPAMAAEHEHGTCNYAGTLCSDCTAGDHDGWTSLADVEGTTLAEGKYYVPEGGYTGSFTVSGGNVVICLNGQTWSGQTTRTLTVDGGATVTIVDCGEKLADNSYVTKGVMKGVQLFTALSGNTSKTSTSDAARGGTIGVNYGTVKFYNGTITGGTAVNGGNVSVYGSKDKKAYFYLNGGQIVGAGQGNWVSYASGTKTSTISSLEGGGIANNRGGNVYVFDYAEFHMGNDQTAAIGDGYAVPSISGGNTLYKQGGNVSTCSTKESYFYLYSGVLKDSFSTDAGGNIHIGSGNFVMTGGKITNGLKQNSATASGANIHHNGGSMTMTGGQIDGGYWSQHYRKTTDAGNLIQLSGTAKIVGTGIEFAYDGTDTTSGGKTTVNYDGITVLRVGNFQEGANIVVRTSTKYFDNDATYPNDTLLVKITGESETYKNFMTEDKTGDG